MIIVKDICSRSGLKREIEFVKSVDDLINKKLQLDCNINYYNPITNEFLGKNIFTKDIVLITLDNTNTLEGIGEYDYWKGGLNDFNALFSKGITSFDNFASYIIMKAYLSKKFD